MGKRLLILTAALALGSAAIAETAQATVVAPAGATQRAAQSLDLTQQVVRICKQVFRCGEMKRGCWWEQQCSITPDYPPENGDQRRRNRNRSRN